MKKIIFFIFIHFNISLYAQNELKYDANITKQPEWVNLMYSEDTDIADVVNAFNIYYKNHELVKNKHTQYYKRWLRNISRFSNAKPILPFQIFPDFFRGKGFLSCFLKTKRITGGCVI